MLGNQKANELSRLLLLCPFLLLYLLPATVPCLLLYTAALAPMCSLGLDALGGVGPYIWPPEDLDDDAQQNHLVFYLYGRLK